MAATGVHQWVPRGRAVQLGVAALWVLIGTWNYVGARDVVGHVLAVSLVVFSLWWASALFSYRVRADDEGLHVRGGWWLTTSVPWSEVAEVRPRRDRSRSPLVVQTRSGRRVTTSLRAADHPSLVTHSRVMTGRATLQDYAVFDHAGSR